MLGHTAPIDARKYSTASDDTLRGMCARMLGERLTPGWAKAFLFTVSVSYDTQGRFSPKERKEIKRIWTKRNDLWLMSKSSRAIMVVRRTGSGYRLMRTLTRKRPVV